MGGSNELQDQVSRDNALEVTTYDELGALNQLTREMDLELAQVTAGRFEGRTLRASVGNAKLHLSKLSCTTVCRGEVSPDHAILILPLRWTGELRWNGALLEESAPILFDDEYTRRASDLELVGFVLDRRTLISTAAGLAGLSEEQIKLPDGVIRARLPEVRSLTRTLLEIARNTRKQPSVLEDSLFARRIGHQVTNACGEMVARLQASFSESRSRRPRSSRVVRDAAYYIEAASDSAFSFADLCRAAGVSARSLQYAFFDHYGLSPTAYLRMHRFNRARRALRRTAPERGAVKRAALDSGFTELGRFSVEYRKLFGESPSATLGRACA